MNWDQIEGQWKNVKGQIREKWGKFTDQDLEVIAGKKDKFLGKLQERYGMAKEEAEKQLNGFIDKIGPESDRNQESQHQIPPKKDTLH